MEPRVSSKKVEDSILIELNLGGNGAWEQRVADPSAALLEAVASQFSKPDIESVTVSAKVSDSNASVDPFAAAAAEMVRGVAGSAALEFAEKKIRVNTVIWDFQSNPVDVSSTLAYLSSANDAGFTTGATIHLEGQPATSTPPSLDGVVLVTGGAGGLGRAAAEKLIAEGRRVVITDMPGDALDKAAEEMGIPFLGANLSDSSDVARLVAWDAADGIDTLLIHHGVGASSRLNDEYDVKSGLRSIAVNGTAVWQVFEGFYPALKKQTSSTAVMLSSQAGLVAEPGNGAYGAAKFAVVGYVRGNAARVKADGIRLQGLCPGPIDTPLMRAAFAGFARDLGISAEEFTAQRLGQVPLKRAGDSAHIGAGASYLSRLDAGGVILAPTGGEVLS